MKRLPVSSRIHTLLCRSRRLAPVSLSLTLDQSNRIAADTRHRLYLSRFHMDRTASRFGVGQTSNPASIRPMYISERNDCPVGGIEWPFWSFVGGSGRRRGLRWIGQTFRKTGTLVEGYCFPLSKRH